MTKPTQAAGEMFEVGPPVEQLPNGRAPDARTLFGRFVSVMPVSVKRHGPQLYRSFADGDQSETLWTYMGYGPFPAYQAFESWLRNCEASSDPLFVTFVRRHNNVPAGMASYLRMEPAHGSAEIGNIWFSPDLQKTRAATEALCLMMRYVLGDLGYRRLEWKCDALNGPSRRAADRLGFTFEGVFRQHMIIKGRNRDTAWYSITDVEWPLIRNRIETWLSDANFHEDGQQITSLAASRT